jgi:uncharacterized small protein (DUF1192 family)
MRQRHTTPRERKSNTILARSRPIRNPENGTERVATGIGDLTLCAGKRRNAGCRAEENMQDDDSPKKKVAHEIGADLSLISVEELKERVVLLQEEIARLEADMARKAASKSAADAFFKR